MQVSSTTRAGRATVGVTAVVADEAIAVFAEGTDAFSESGSVRVGWPAVVRRFMITGSAVGLARSGRAFLRGRNDMADQASIPEQSLSPASREIAPSRILTAAVVILIMVGTLAAVFGGPALGDHEAIVALCARNMRLSGDWLVPDYAGTPWFRKPPLPYWLIAAVSYVLSRPGRHRSCR